MLRNHRFWHREHGKIEYHEDDGNLWYSYYDEVSLPTKYHAASYLPRKAEGIIPSEIVAQGEKAIKEYAEEKVKEKLEAIDKAFKEGEERDKNLNHPIETMYEGVLLKGKIVSYEDTALTVRLVSPFRGETFVIYGWASAVLGHRVFEDDGVTFTADGIRTAQNLLVQIYKEKKYQREHKDMIDLADNLNKET